MAVAKRVEELIAWQRMYELSVEIWHATETGASARDFKHRDQIRDASDSAQRNIAEGFARYNPGEFVRFLDVARASGQETRVLLKKARATGYLTERQFGDFDRLAIRGLVAMARLQRYLRSPEGKRKAQRNRYRRRR